MKAKPRLEVTYLVPGAKKRTVETAELGAPLARLLSRLYDDGVTDLAILTNDGYRAPTVGEITAARKYHELGEADEVVAGVDAPCAYCSGTDHGTIGCGDRISSKT